MDSTSAEMKTAIKIDYDEDYANLTPEDRAQLQEEIDATCKNELKFETAAQACVHTTAR